MSANNEMIFKEDAKNTAPFLLILFSCKCYYVLGSLFDVKYPFRPLSSGHRERNPVSTGCNSS